MRKSDKNYQESNKVKQVGYHDSVTKAISDQPQPNNKCVILDET